MNLHELLQVEESLRNWEFVRAASRGQESLKFSSIRQFGYDFVHLSQRFWINKFSILAVKNCLHEQFANAVNVRIL